MDRRDFVRTLIGGTFALSARRGVAMEPAVQGGPVRRGLVQHVASASGGWDPRLYAHLLGAASAVFEKTEGMLF